ncbi:serine/threonine protein phosphatase [Brevibacillus brevis X23]|nr:serine/threonine protein phosphatase [Brevibacillus brevis X23]
MSIYRRMLVMSDLHGCHDLFTKMLEKVAYDPTQDRLILLGDYVDRGRYSKQVLNKVIELVNTYGAVALVGNHDKMFLDWLLTNDGMNEFNFFRNGGLQTVESYCGLDFFDAGIDTVKAKRFILKNFNHHISFLSELPYYHEEDDYIFVHAGLNPTYENWRLTPYSEMIWIREEFHNGKVNTDKTIVFGHTPCVHLHGKADIWYWENKIGIDGAAAYGHQLNCLEITNEGLKEYNVKAKEV